LTPTDDAELPVDERRGTRVSARPSARRVWDARSVVAIAAAVLVVHGVHVTQPLYWDDYSWYGLSDHAGWLGRAFTPNPDVYRPLVAVWFAATRAVFGFSALPYHLMALAFLLSAALMVRVLGLRLGMTGLTATAAGVVYGSFGALTLTTIWASSAGGELAVASAIGAMVLVIDGRSPARVAGAAVLFVVALLLREASVTAPALLLIVALARRGRELRWRDVAAELRHGAVLWIVAAAYVAARLAGGLPSPSSPYATKLVGGHVVSNAKALLQDAARFGMPLDSTAARIWDAVFWFAILLASVYVLRRWRPLPLAGLAWFQVACLPVLFLTRHGMEPYYLDIALVGLAISLASLLACFVRSRRIVAGVLVAFVALQVVAVRRFDDDGTYNVAIRRSEAMHDLARTLPVHDGTLVVDTHCPLDTELSKDGELFRVVRDQPALEVRFVIERPQHC
jgi:hypothetical protein